jgi:hypothetical protein
VPTESRQALASAVRPEHAEPVDAALATVDPRLPGIPRLGFRPVHDGVELSFG